MFCQREEIGAAGMMLYYPDSNRFRSILELKDNLTLGEDQEVFFNVISIFINYDIFIKRQLFKMCFLW